MGPGCFTTTLRIRIRCIICAAALIRDDYKRSWTALSTSVCAPGKMSFCLQPSTSNAPAWRITKKFTRRLGTLPVRGAMGDRR